MNLNTHPNMSREGVTTAGVFLSVPDAFPDSLPDDVRSTVKLLFELAPDSAASAARGVNPTVEFATDVVMLDFGSLDPSSFDPEQAIRDCEILAGILKSNGARVSDLITALQQGNDDGIDRGEEIVESIGLTEEAFVKQGGGLIWVAVLVGLALLSKGCATTRHAEKGRSKGSTTTPKPPPNP